MSDPVALLAALIRARRSGDRAVLDATLTRLRVLGVHVQFGDALPLRTPKVPVAGVNESRTDC